MVNGIKGDPDCPRNLISEPPEANEPLADIFEEYARDQSKWILDFADALEKMLSNGYQASELVDAPDHYTGVVCPRIKQNVVKTFYNCFAEYIFRGTSNGRCHFEQTFKNNYK